MSAEAANADAEVFRLTEMEVREVSLVDRAANQRRFLVVKRSDEMADDDSAADAELAKDADPGAVLLGAAVTALERLTDTVETLSMLADGDARDTLTEAASELRSLADDLIQAAGGAPAPVAAAAPAGDAAARPDVAAQLALVRSTLGEVGSLIAEAKRVRAKRPLMAESGKAPTSEADPKADEKADKEPKEKRESTDAPPVATTQLDAGLRTELAALTAAVTKLTETTQSQLQRLTHLEKQVGLPNSAPPTEPVEKAADPVGWPLDMNRPLNRDAVDKAVSFHDL